MPSKDDRLVDHLTSLNAPDVMLTFAAVESLVGPLSRAARHDATWWGVTDRSRYQFAHAMRWWQAGYAADRPDFAAETVTFRRIGVV